MKSIYEVLDSLDIKYTKYDHPKVFTVEEANRQISNIKAGHTKNLFLRDKKGTKHYLVILEANKRADLKVIAKKLGTDRFSFASSDRMMKYLGLTPGSVSPFGLINNVTHDITVAIDKDLLEMPEIGFHPNSNDATLVITSDDFKKFLTWTTNKVEFIEI